MSGLSRTPGKRVWVNSPPRVRIPPAPPKISKGLDFQGLFCFLEKSLDELLGHAPNRSTPCPLKEPSPPTTELQSHRLTRYLTAIFCRRNACRLSWMPRTMTGCCLRLTVLGTLTAMQSKTVKEAMVSNLPCAALQYADTHEEQDATTKQLGYCAFFCPSLDSLPAIRRSILSLCR